MIKLRIKILSIFLTLVLNSHASIVVYGNASTAPFGFTSPIVVKAYDRPTGTFFVGIEDSNAARSGDFSLAKALRPSQSKVPKFSGIGKHDILHNQTLEMLTIIPAKFECDVDEIVPYMLAMVIENNGTPFTQTSVTASTNDGNSVVSSIALDDATGMATTEGIVQIAANTCYIVPAMRPNNGDFGSAGSGIGLVNVQANPLTLTVLDATTGMPGNMAAPFDNTITELKGDGGGDNVTFSTDPHDVNEVAMYYDEILKRFYIGVRIATGTQANDIAKSVVVTQLNPEEANQVEFFPIVSDTAIPAGTATSKIVVAKIATNGDPAINLRALHLRVMHCSTGPDYLIVNGGEGTTEQVGNQFFAMPLVNDCANEEFHGTLADVNSDLNACDVFTVPATDPDELFDDTDDRAIVGAGDLPIQPNQEISDMVVVGDAVYVAIDIAPECDENPNLSNDTGIFYSQALFDAEGKIARWSPWKRATPFDAFAGIEFAPCLSHDGQVKFFEVDAKTGNVWIVEGTTDELVGYTNWSRGADECGLLAQLNELLCSGCYAGLDLNQQTRGFLNATEQRYALFGGASSVAIALVSQTCDITDPLSPEELITNFDCDQTMFIDELPELESSPCPLDAGCASVLEYSRRTQAEGDTNYFFAGTETGLYVFNVNGGGFNVTELGLLNEAPFITGRWSHIDTIPGAVIDIKTSGAKLYVLTQEQSEEQPFINTLYSIPFADTIDVMFDEANLAIIAQNEVDDFADICAFFAIAIISTGEVDNDLLAPQKEQLILATSDGLFTSNANQNPGNGIIDATNQTDANWELIEGTDSVCFDHIGFIDVPVQHTVWPSNVADSRAAAKTFDRSDINQLSGTGNLDGTIAEIGTFEPEFFNADSDNRAFETLYPITYFWSDGGRRFFLINRTTAAAPGSQIAVLPFEVEDWNVRQFLPLFNPALERYRSINWIRNFGATGLIIAGTNQGVVGLE